MKDCRACLGQALLRDIHVSKSLIGRTPFARVHIDLLSVGPASERGYHWILTLVCLATRFVYFRCLMTKDAKTAALHLFLIVLDMLVVPLHIQHDSGEEFMSQMLTELLLLGARPMCNIAFHPQTNGIIERNHREIRRVLRCVVETVLRARPRQWAIAISITEAKLRTQTVADNGVTPAACLRGIFEANTLQPALQQIKRIPEDYPLDAWVREVVAASQLSLRNVKDALGNKTQKRNQHHAETTPLINPMTAGALVLLRKGYLEKDANGLVTPVEGPYRITIADEIGARLEDVCSKIPVFDGGSIALTQLILHEYPLESLINYMAGDGLTLEESAELEGRYYCGDPSGEQMAIVAH